MNWSHVHIGAGKFGLGMVVDLCDQAGFTSAVLNRATNQKHHPTLQKESCYRISYDGGEHQSRTVRVDIHQYQNDRDPHAIELLASPSVLLLTTSVTPDGLEHVAPLIARAIERRSTVTGASTLCVMACENLRLNAEVLARQIAANLTSQTATQFLEDRVVFCNTVVDRVCDDVTWNEGGVEVQTESFHEWIVERPIVDIDAIRMLADHGFVTLAKTRAELKAYEMRKYWCLNGLHLAAAAYAYQHTHEESLAAALRMQGILSKVKALQQELGFAFRCYAEEAGVLEMFSERDVDSYNGLVLRRFTANKRERIARLLKHEDDIEGAVDTFVGLVSKAVLKEGIDSAVRKHLMSVLRVFDLHSFVTRVVERIVGPQQQILSFYKRSGMVPPRLELDDALQTITLAINRYAKKAYDRAVASVRRNE